MEKWSIPVCVMCLAQAAFGAGAAPAPKSAAPAAAAEAYARIAEAYMDGDWAELDKHLNASARHMPAMAPAQKQDVLYVRQALAECRPAWWMQCKAGQKTPINPAIWGRPFTALYDPAGKGVQIQSSRLTVGWDPTHMDSTEPGEYGFTKGDLANLGAWYSLGMGMAWAAVPAKAMINMNPGEKLRLELYLNFRGNVTGLYYASPPARRWALHIYLAAFIEKYGKAPVAAARRAAASMFMTDVLTAPGKYPSLKLPDVLPADGAEEKLGVHFKFKIGRKTHWTIAEDKAFREAVKAFGLANDAQVLQTGKVMLPNKLIFALEADQDAALRPKRDEWFKAQFDKAAGK